MDKVHTKRMTQLIDNLEEFECFEGVYWDFHAAFKEEKNGRDVGCAFVRMALLWPEFEGRPRDAFCISEEETMALFFTEDANDLRKKRGLPPLDSNSTRFDVARNLRLFLEKAGKDGL